MGTNLATYRRIRRFYLSLTPAQRVGMTPERLAFLASQEV